MLEDKRESRWLLNVVAAVLAILILFGSFTYYIDPACHYHKPLENHSYTHVYAFYLNDGIIKNYDYTGVITGTSMTHNFKTSEAEEIFGGSFIKIPLSSASYKEISGQLYRMFDYGKNPKYVIRGLDENMICQDKDTATNEFSKFEHIYNDKLYDDVKYLLNLELFFKYTFNAIPKTDEAGKPPIDFDKYCSWEYKTGRDAVTASYEFLELADKEIPFTPEDRKTVLDNIRQNVTAVAYEHPDTEFICFITPFSVYFWNTINAEKRIHQQIEIEKTAAEEMLKCPNIKLYAFSDNFDLICDADNYRDSMHYKSEVNSQVLKWISEDKYRLTEENFLDYYDRIEKFYSEYNYAELRG